MANDDPRPISYAGMCKHGPSDLVWCRLCNYALRTNLPVGRVVLSDYCTSPWAAWAQYMQTDLRERYTGEVTSDG